MRRRDLAPRTGAAWSPEEIAYLKANLEVLTIDEIATHLTRTRAGVQMYLWNKLGIRKARVSGAVNSVSPPPRGPGRPYSQRDVDWLLDHARPGALRKLGHLRRTYRGAYCRLWREGVRLREADGLLSVNEAARLVEMPRRTLARWVQHGLLHAERPSGSREWRLEFDEAERAAAAWRRGERPSSPRPPSPGVGGVES